MIQRSFVRDMFHHSLDKVKLGLRARLGLLQAL